MISGCIKGDGQSAGGIIFAEERIGDGGAAGLAWVPGFKDRGGLLRGVLQCERAAIHQDNDQGLAGGGESIDKLLLGGGEFDGGAVAAFESLDVQRHLLAFDLGAEAEERDDRV